MDLSEARAIYRSVFKSASQLTRTIEKVDKSTIADEEARELKMKLAKQIANIHLNIGSVILEKFSELQIEIDKELEEHGRLIE